MFNGHFFETEDRFIRVQELHTGPQDSSPCLAMDSTEIKCRRNPRGVRISWINSFHHSMNVVLKLHRIQYIYPFNYGGKVTLDNQPYPCQGTSASLRTKSSRATRWPRPLKPRATAPSPLKWSTLKYAWSPSGNWKALLEGASGFYLKSCIWRTIHYSHDCFKTQSTSFCLPWQVAFNIICMIWNNRIGTYPGWDGPRTGRGIRRGRSSSPASSLS